jgi:hypothetical protein
MKSKAATMSSLILGIAFFFPEVASPQGKPDAGPAPANRVIEDYPEGDVGVLIQAAEWTAIPQEGPSRTRVERGWAASLSYGAVPANLISEYAGAHASVQIAPRRVLICLCGFDSLPGSPALVKLRPKKETRELDGGRLQPFRGKVSEARQSDLLSIDVSHPDDGVWLVQSIDSLPPGEYALMVGTQNMNIFPFTITDKQSTSSASSEKP